MSYEDWRCELASSERSSTLRAEEEMDALEQETFAQANKISLWFRGEQFSYGFHFYRSREQDIVTITTLSSYASIETKEEIDLYLAKAIFDRFENTFKKDPDDSTCDFVSTNEADSNLLLDRLTTRIEALNNRSSSAIVSSEPVASIEAPESKDGQEPATPPQA